MAQIRQMIDQSNEAQTREQLEFLLSAARGRVNSFENELNLMFLNPEAQGKIQIVGTRALTYVKEYRANITAGVDKEILAIIDEFFTGTSDGVKNGFQNLIKIGLKSILGTETAGEWLQEMFVVLPENLAFVRVDIKVWRYNFSSEGIISKAKNAFAFIFSKSIVDHRKLTEDELIFFIAQMVGNDIEKVKAFLADLKELWKLIGDKEPNRLGPNHVTKVFER
jgi:hypothetical protein